MIPRPLSWTCPECGEVIEVAIVSTRWSRIRRRLLVRVLPDFADAQAHVWTHTEVA